MPLFHMEVWLKIDPKGHIFKYQHEGSVPVPCAVSTVQSELHRGCHQEAVQISLKNK